jgi:ATP-dependent Clp protease ATP-binding subunit ClpA
MGGKLLREQLSMYQNNENISYLFGEKHSQDSFAKQLINRESNVILLDEFDKAHPAVYGAFYQVFDEGIFKDKNYEVKLNNTIIICTSNYNDEADIRKQIGDPMFSRFDATIKFSPLADSAKKNIVEKEIAFQLKRLNESERKLIKRLKVEDFIRENAFKNTNYRTIRNYVNDTFSIVLLKDYLKN